MTHVVACPVCHQPHQIERLDEGSDAYCVRCGSRISSRPRNSLHRTAAYALAAMILYLPANVLPVIRIEQNGVQSDSTVLGSAKLLWDSDDHFVAIIVFLASFVIPILKLIGLTYLVLTTWLGSTRWPKFRTYLYRGIDSIGRWAMLDVFVLAVLVSVVKLEKLANVYPGGGALPFTIVVILTLASSTSFDPHLIWARQRLRKGRAVT